MSEAQTPPQSVPDLSDMFEKQRTVALAVSSCGGRADGSTINQRVAFPSNLVRHHAKRLVDHGILRETGNRNEGVRGGDPAIEYELTDTGRSAVARYRGLSEGVTTDARLNSLENELRATQAELDEMTERFERLLDRIGRHD